MGGVKSSSQRRQSADIIGRFSVIAEVKSMISSLAYCDEAMVELATIIADSLVRLQFFKEEQDQKDAAADVLTGKTYHDLLDNNRPFEGFLEQFGRRVLREVKQVNRSRIYHTTANILLKYLIRKGLSIPEQEEKAFIFKKQPSTEQSKYHSNLSKKQAQSNLQSFLSVNFDNTFKINMQKYFYKINAYRYLSSGELDRVVILEKIAEQIENLGERIKYKYRDAKNESDQMIDFLNRGFGPHQEALLSTKEDMSELQVQAIAKIARQACNFYQEGFFLLIVYLTRSMYRLQRQGQSAEQIERKLKQALQTLQGIYPVGNKVGDGRQQTEKILKQYEVKGSHRFQPYDLSIRNKSKQVQDLVADYASLACKHIEDFQKLMFDTCLKRSLGHKISVRYSPSSPNPKAMNRILEEMLLQDVKIQKSTCSSIEDSLNYEDKLFQKVITETLDKLDSVEFNIKDMVRGKCTFAQMHEIAEIVKSIKNFVRQRPQTYRLIKIESRFKNPVPFSDVVINLLIRQKIPAELRLIYQSNSAAYKFSSKLNELSRESILSSIKIVHNHFEQSRDRFGQMIERSLPLRVDGGVPRVTANKEALYEYFGISGEPLVTFDEVFNHIWKQRISRIVDFNDTQIQFCTDQENQDLIRPIFLKKVGKWQADIGKIYDRVLNETDSSPLLKSVLVENFLRDFNPAHHVRYIHQFFTLFQRDPQRSQKNYIQSYIEHRYRIKSLGKYALETARSYYSWKQIDSIEYRLKEMKLQAGSCPIYIDLVYGIKSSHTAKMVIRKLQFLSQINDYEAFDRYSKLLFFIKQSVSFKDIRKEFLVLQLISVHHHLKNNRKQTNNSSTFLMKLKKDFLSESMFEHALQCEFLLAEVRFQAARQAQFNEQYHKIVQLATTQSISLDGQIIAESQWRVGMKVLRMDASKGRSDSARAALMTHISKAINYFVRQYHAEQLFQKLRQVWQLLKAHKIDPPAFEPNAHIMRFVLSDQLYDGELDILVQPQWPALTTLGLRTNVSTQLGIGSVIRDVSFFQSHDGPVSVSSVSVTTILSLRVAELQVKRTGRSQHLLKWFNRIGDRGCEFLVTAKWPLLSSLLLSGNDIGDEGCKVLSQGNWHHMKTLWLRSNKVEVKGLKALAKARWQKLADLDLRNNTTLYLMASKEEIKEQSLLMFSQPKISVKL